MYICTYKSDTIIVIRVGTCVIIILRSVPSCRSFMPFRSILERIIRTTLAPRPSPPLAVCVCVRVIDVYRGYGGGGTSYMYKHGVGHIIKPPRRLRRRFGRKENGNGKKKKKKLLQPPAARRRRRRRKQLAGNSRVTVGADKPVGPRYSVCVEYNVYADAILSCEFFEINAIKIIKKKRDFYSFFISLTEKNPVDCFFFPHRSAKTFNCIESSTEFKPINVDPRFGEIDVLIERTINESLCTHSDQATRRRVTHK